MRLQIQSVVLAAFSVLPAFSMLAIVLIFFPTGLLGRPEVEKV